MEDDGPQWCGDSEAAGEAARIMWHPSAILFYLLVWDACHVSATTCNDRQSIHLGG